MPEGEQKYVQKTADLFNIIRKYNLGSEALEDTFEKAKGLSQKVKATIAKHGTDGNGKVAKRWNKLSTERRNLMVKELHTAAPWLEEFEDDWACEWVLSKGINQRTSNGSHSSYREKEQERKRRLAQAIFNLEVLIETGKFSIATCIWS